MNQLITGFIKFIVFIENIKYVSASVERVEQSIIIILMFHVEHITVKYFALSAIERYNK